MGYTTIAEAYQRVLSCASAYGKPMRVYQCPKNPKVFHITSRR